MIIWQILSQRSRRYFCSFVLSDSGQVLAEIIFALAMAVLLIFGMVVAIRAGLLNSQFSEHKVQSTYLAQESIEMVRSYRDAQGWDQVTISNVSSFGDTGSSNLVLENSTETVFQRNVDIEDINIASANDAKRITVTVSWTEKESIVETKLTTILTDYK